MAQEIERKFLVKGDGWRDPTNATRYRQGYLSTDKARTVRVRTAGDKAYLTIKGATEGVSRAEFEYPIPLDDANQLLGLCHRPLIEKDRYLIPYGDHEWEVDEFFGDNEGLVVAEVELESEDQPFERPDWVGPEVSDDPRYFNASLVAHPYREWRES